MDVSTSPALRECTAKIVSSYLTRNQVAPTEVASVISTVFNALSVLGAPEVIDARQPAVPIRRSIRPDSLICLDCGFKGKILRRHLNKDHNLTPEEYRKRWNLPRDYPIVAPNYSRSRSMLAKQLGLGRSGNPAIQAQPEPIAETAPQPVPETVPAKRSARGRGRPRRAEATA